jgi:hypothetical protein
MQDDTLQYNTIQHAVYDFKLFMDGFCLPHHYTKSTHSLIIEHAILNYTPYIP